MSHKDGIVIDAGDSLQSYYAKSAANFKDYALAELNAAHMGSTLFCEMGAELGEPLGNGVEPKSGDYATWAAKNIR